MLPQKARTDNFFLGTGPQMGCKTCRSRHSNPCANVGDTAVWGAHPDAKCPADTGGGAGGDPPAVGGETGVPTGGVGGPLVNSAARNTRAGPPLTATGRTAAE